MADQIDEAQAFTEAHNDRQIAAARAAARIPVGVAGECTLRGEDMPRLIGGVCAPCRDGRRVRHA